jgi:hypothetical protein
LLPGVIVRIPGRFLQVPELDLGQREDNEEFLETFQNMPPLPANASREAVKAREKEWMGMLRKILVLALSRNYPKVEDADVRSFTMSDLRKGVTYAIGGPQAGETAAAPVTAHPNGTAEATA